MRFALCDDDQLFTSMIEAMLRDLGHEVVGLATTTPDAVALVEAARPDVVIVDLSLGFNTDFDVLVAADTVGATPIVFAYTADDAILRRYPTRPTVVFKPDLPELERVVTRLTVDSEHRVVAHERRVRPTRAVGAPAPTGLTDAQAFYEAVNEAVAGDALVSIDLPEGLGADVDEMAARVREALRESDRLLGSTTGVRVFLLGADEVGITSFTTRLDALGALPAGATVRSVVVASDESPSAAFDRLKHAV